MTTLPRRLHPATMLIELARRLASFAYIIVIALALRFLGSQRPEREDFYEYVIAGVAVLSALGAVFRYVTLTYAVESGNLIVRSGLVTRHARSIPIDRIQNMTLKRGVLHRLMGVVDVEIETAGGSKAEAVLSALSHAAAEQLKQDVGIDRGTDAITQPDAAAPGDSRDEIWQSPLSDLMLAGATENRLGLILATAVGGWYTFQDPIRRVLERFLPKLEAVLLDGAIVLVGIGVLFAIVLIIVGWITSIILTITQYYGFQLRRSDTRLRVRYGLFTQNEKLIPAERIQVVRLVAPWLRDRLGYVTVFAETAGSIVDRQAAASTPFCPLVRRDRVAGLLTRVLPTLDYAAVRWQNVSRKAIRRAMIRYSALLAVPVGTLVWVASWPGTIAIPLAIAAAAIGARWRYECLGFARLSGYIFARAGAFTRRAWIIPRDKVQYVELRQTPFQRRHDLASLAIFTAGGAFGSAAIVDLPTDVARALQDEFANTRRPTAAVADGV